MQDKVIFPSLATMSDYLLLALRDEAANPPARLTIPGARQVWMQRVGDNFALYTYDDNGNVLSLTSSNILDESEAGLLVHWPLTSGSTVNDIVGGYLATGNLSFTADGVIPNSNPVSFPQFSNYAGLDLTKDFTISFYYRMANHAKQRILISDPSDEGNLQVAFWDSNFRVNFLGVTALRNDFEWDWDDGTNDDGEFRQVVLTRLGDYAYIYRNSEMLAVGTATTMSNLAPKLGNYPYDAGDVYMQGLIRDFKIYNTGKTPVEVQKLYVRGK